LKNELKPKMLWDRWCLEILVRRFQALVCNKRRIQAREKTSVKFTESEGKLLHEKVIVGPGHVR
jgi:hypothetical protein